MANQEMQKWTDLLSDEDMAFIKRFVLASGSLKALAADYGISYPTVRIRLDRLIAKIEVIESQRISSPFERRIRAMYADGKIDMDTLRTILAAHKAEMETNDEDKK